MAPGHAEDKRRGPFPKHQPLDATSMACRILCVILVMCRTSMNTPPNTVIASVKVARRSAPFASARAVLVLHFQEEMPLAEVAAILELPLGTVKSRLAYGLAALRRKPREGV
jgi:hypothetical protein